jgi:hypothetical protein
LIKAQGLGRRIYDATTGLCLNDSIKLGAHTVIEEQTKRQWASRIRGMVRLMKDGGVMGNQDIARQSAIGISTKARIAKEREADVLSAVSQVVIFYRGRIPSFEEICDELDRRDIRTGQGNFFTPERLAQYKKSCVKKWNRALDSYHRPRRSIRKKIMYVVVELSKRRRCNAQMKSLLGTRINKPICVDPNCSEWVNRISNSLFQPSRQHSVTQVSDGCRGPPEGLRTACSGLLSHRLKPLSKHETDGDNPSVDERTFMLAIINDLKPKDPVERMLAVQMTTTHVATIRAGMPMRSIFTS